MSFENAVAQLEQTNAQLVNEVVRARDAIMGLNKMHPTITAGRDAVAVGEYFTVPGTGTLYATLYQKTGATTQTAVAEFPSRQAYNEVKNASGITFAPSGTGLSSTNVQAAVAELAAKDALVQQTSPSILIVDQLRASVEAESGGLQTVIYTAKKQPCIMNVIPRFNMEDIPGFTAGTGTHPAFIFNGVAKSEIMVAAFQASEIAGEAISRAGLAPRVNINYDNARALCKANGAGWDMMSNWDWAALALWCMANGFQPRGNTNHGRHHDNRWETGRRQDNGIPGDAGGAGNILTGSGPNQWRHNNSANGISDLVGNVWEWVTGFKIVDNIAHVQPDNGELAEASYLNTSYALGATGPFSTRPNAGAPDILKQALIVPNGAADPAGYFYITNTGERLPLRGGDRNGGAVAGLGALILNNARTSANSSRGFRPVFRN